MGIFNYTIRPTHIYSVVGGVRHLAVVHRNMTDVFSVYDPGAAGVETDAVKGNKARAVHADHRHTEGRDGNLRVLRVVIRIKVYRPLITVKIRLAWLVNLLDQVEEEDFMPSFSRIGTRPRRGNGLIDRV